MRPRTKISRITQAQESMATALDQETVHTETTAEPSATPVEAPASSVGGTRVSRTSVTSIHDADYTGRVVSVIWWIVGFVDVVLIIRFHGGPLPRHLQCRGAGPFHPGTGVAGRDRDRLADWVGHRLADSHDDPASRHRRSLTRA